MGNFSRDINNYFKKTLETSRKEEKNISLGFQQNIDLKEDSNHLMRVQEK